MNTTAITVTCKDCKHVFTPTVAEVMVPCRPRIRSIEVEDHSITVIVDDSSVVGNVRTDMAAADNFFFDCPECGSTIESPPDWTVEIDEEA